MQANSAASYFQTPVTLSLSDILTIVGLIISVVLNIIQWRSARNIKASLYNGIVGIFNAIGWTLGYSISRQKSVHDRISNTPPEKAELRASLEELSDFANSIDHQCRHLHEQVVAVAKTLQIADARWQGQFFGLSNEEIKRIMEASK